MSLTLRVQTYRKQAPAVPVERRFDQLGGTIGRAAGNDLELPDPGKYISRNHSKIDFADGRYTLMDLGANPSWINDRPVGTGKVASLEHGDRLMIGDYVLEVVVEHGAPVAAPVFSTETSDALPFQAQPHDPAAQAAPQYEPVADTLAGMKVLDVAGRFDPLAAPSANDPLGLGQPDGAPPVMTPQQAAAYRGSEADHVAPQFIPMPGSLLPGQQPGIAAPEGGYAQPPAYPQGNAQPVPPVPPQAIGQPFAYSQPQPEARPQPNMPAHALSNQALYADPGLPAAQAGHGQPAAPQPQAWPQPFPAAGGQAGSPLQPSPYAPEPTVLVMRTPTAAPTLPPAPAMLIPDDYDPLADLAPPRAPAPAQGWPQPGAQAAMMPQAGVTSAGQPPAPPLPPAAMQTIGPGTASGWPAPGAWNGAAQPAIPAAWQDAQPQAGWPSGVPAAPAPQGAGWSGAVQPRAPQHGLQHGSQYGQAPAGAGWPGQPPLPSSPSSPAAGWTPPAPGQQAWPAAQAYPAQAYPAQPGQGDAILQALLRGMGLSALQLNRDPLQTAELAGAMLREAMAGTMAVLMARAMTKRESRLDMTVLGAQANNPLKFFPDAESALAQMLTNAMSGYMPPVKAIGSAFDDLKAHELAVIAGMRAALKGVMARFDPAQIEASEPQGVMDKMMAATRKARMWDSMVALYDDIVREADDDFQHLFGEKFSAAYEDQIGRLRP